MPCHGGHVRCDVYTRCHLLRAQLGKLAGWQLILPPRTCLAAFNTGKVFWSTYTVLSVHVWMIIHRLGRSSDPDVKVFRQRFYMQFQQDVEHRVYSAGLQVGPQCHAHCPACQTMARGFHHGAWKPCAACLGRHYIYGAWVLHLAQASHASGCAARFLARAPQFSTASRLEISMPTRHAKQGACLPGGPTATRAPHTVRGFRVLFVVGDVLQVGVTKWLKKLEEHFYATGYAMDDVSARRAAPCSRMHACSLSVSYDLFAGACSCR